MDDSNPADDAPRQQSSERSVVDGAAAARYVSGPEQDADWRAQAGAAKEPFRMKEKHMVWFLSGCGIFGLGAFVGLIVLLCSIHTLAIGEQVLVETPSGSFVENGPDTVVLRPEHKKTFRQATRLSIREYAEVKDFRSGEIRHQGGPGLVFLGPYEEIKKIHKIIMVQRDEYMRLIDQMTGSERVVSGPDAIIPKPLEIAPRGVEKSVVLGVEKSVLVRFKSTGMLKLITQGGVYVPQAYEEILEIRNGTLLNMKEYAVLRNTLEGITRSVPGPQLLHIGAYEELIGIRDKIILRKDEYVRLRSKQDGTERVVRGPQSFVPDFYEQTVEGKQRATFLDLDTAALVLDRSTGQQRLVTQKGVFIPSPYEEVLKKQSLIRVLPHESMVIRDAEGSMSIIGTGSGSETFFLQPYWSILQQTWSSYSEDLSNETDAEQAMAKVTFDKIDLRLRLMKFRYSVLTHDNVKLIVEGNIFWKVHSVSQMVKTTSDPAGDVWLRTRSTMMQAVSRVTMADFMWNLKQTTKDVLQLQTLDGFYADRGVQVESMEVTRFEVADPATAEVLRSIIEESTNRINLLQKQAGADEVKTASLTQDIEREKKRASLVILKATNTALQAEMAGDVEGLKRLGFAQTFIGGLNASVPSIDSRIDLYKHYHEVQATNQVTHDVASSVGRLFLNPADLQISLKAEL